MGPSPVRDRQYARGGGGKFTPQTAPAPQGTTGKGERWREEAWCRLSRQRALRTRHARYCQPVEYPSCSVVMSVQMNPRLFGHLGGQRVTPILSASRTTRRRDSTCQQSKFTERGCELPLLRWALISSWATYPFPPDNLTKNGRNGLRLLAQAHPRYSYPFVRAILQCFSSHK